jgi:hypothetical protein
MLCDAAIVRAVDIMLCMHSSALCMHAMSAAGQRPPASLKRSLLRNILYSVNPSGRHIDHADSDDTDEFLQRLCDDEFCTEMCTGIHCPCCAGQQEPILVF